VWVRRSLDHPEIGRIEVTMSARSIVSRSAVVVALALASCSTEEGSRAPVTAPVHVPVSLVADWLPAGFGPQAGSIDTSPVDLTDASGRPAGTFTPATGLILSGTSSSSAAGPMVLIAATWIDDLPPDYWEFVSKSPIAQVVTRDQRDLIVVPSSSGTLLYFRENGLVVMTTAVGLSLDDAERLAASLRVVEG
jgi:hypothetical protein